MGVVFRETVYESADKRFLLVIFLLSYMYIGVEMPKSQPTFLGIVGDSSVLSFAGESLLSLAGY
jgi:hypothetical protein